jgi:uncharacterized protein YndB with AHSA1/START domain
VTSDDPSASGRTVTLRREYPDPVEDVWAALTEPEWLARWIGSYTGTGVVGGTVDFTLTGEVDAGGTVADPVPVAIHECVPPRRLVVEIPDASGTAWLVGVTLSYDDGRTALLFEQRVVEGVDPADVAAGWNWYLDRLGAVLRAAPMPDWADYAPS